jgi:hypothetical protein
MDFSKNDLSKARVGDKIWDLFKQEFQTVREVTPNSNWPIEFERGGFCSFGGFATTNCCIPRYYWDEIKFEIPPPPKRTVRKEVKFWVAFNRDGSPIGYTKDIETVGCWNRCGLIFQQYDGAIEIPE